MELVCRWLIADAAVTHYTYNYNKEEYWYWFRKASELDWWMWQAGHFGNL